VYNYIPNPQTIPGDVMQTNILFTRQVTRLPNTQLRRRNVLSIRAVAHQTINLYPQYSPKHQLHLSC